MPCRFIQIPIELLQFVRKSKLTSLQHRLWLYFYELDPFGDRSVPIPSIAQIAAEFEVCTRSIQTAIGRLSDLGLMKFSYANISVQNTTTNIARNSQKVRTKQAGKNFHKDDQFGQNSKKFSKDGKNFPVRSEECSQSKHSTPLQTNSDINQTVLLQKIAFSNY